MKGISPVFFTDKPRYSGEHWRVVIIEGASATNHGFTSEEAANEFRNQNIKENNAQSRR